MAVTTYYFSLNASSAPSSTVYVFVSSNLSSTPTKASLVSGQAYLRTTASTYSSLASPVYVWLSSNSSSYVDSGLAFANGRKYATMSTSTTSSNAPLNTVATTAGTNKIDQLEINNYVYDIDLPVDATPVVASVQTNKFLAPTSSGGSTYGVGSNGQVLTSNGTTHYWATPSGGGNTLYRHDIIFTTEAAGEPECCSFTLITSSSTPLNTSALLFGALETNKKYTASGFVYEMKMSSDPQWSYFPIITHLVCDGTDISFAWFNQEDDGWTDSASLRDLTWNWTDSVTQIS